MPLIATLLTPTFVLPPCPRQFGDCYSFDAKAIGNFVAHHDEIGQQVGIFDMHELFKHAK